MKRLLLAALALTPLVAGDLEPAKRLGDAAAVFSAVMATPEDGIPPDLLEHAFCIVIVPDGKGYLFCRNNAGPGWSAPGAVRIEGKTFLPQGSTVQSLIMLVMNQRRAEQMLASKFTLGAEASVAAGPVGSHSTGDPHADVLSWSRSEGVFTGIALEGVTLWQVVDDNAILYGGNKLENRDIVTEGVLPPKSAAKILDLLNRYSFREEKPGHPE